MKIKQQIRHECSLSKEQEGDILRSAYSYSIRKLAFWYQSFRTVDKNEGSIPYFRSQCAFLKEKKRHLLPQEYKLILHPFSQIIRKKRVIMFFMWLTSFVMDPFLGTFYAKIYLHPDRGILPFDFIQGIMPCFYLIDVILRFYTGYFIEMTGVVVLEPKKIYNDYLKTYFFFYFFGVVHMFFMLVLRRYLSLKAQVLIYPMVSIRVVRLITLLYNFNVVLREFRCREVARKIYTTVLFSILLIHWSTCLQALVPAIREIHSHRSKESWLTPLYLYRQNILVTEETNVTRALEFQIFYGTFVDYLHHVQLVNSHFFGAGVGEYQTHDALERMLFFILTAGLMYWTTVLAHILQIFGTLYISESKFEELAMEVKHLMLRNRFPKRLRKRIRRYYTLKSHRKFSSETIILNTLSEHLRMEVLLYSCQIPIDDVQIYPDLDELTLDRILHRKIALCPH
ncbi:hypothetical protein Zmor_016885 [Zophobas morio]|uniref:Uncharacterized protein n=1 Tax=Zophobas morio TaxID=2755281 RepID=A0AA38I8D5_9CUCU|nr:hypothetical protein Zmor_016885 [Zophobas morio]